VALRSVWRSEIACLLCMHFSFKVAIYFVINTKARFFVSCHFRRMCCNIIWHRLLRLVGCIPLCYSGGLWFETQFSDHVFWLSVVMILFSLSKQTLEQYFKARARPFPATLLAVHHSDCPYHSMHKTYAIEEANDQLYRCKDWESKYRISIFAVYFILLSISM
jgi:hypothetical protein